MLKTLEGEKNKRLPISLSRWGSPRQLRLKIRLK